MYRSARSIALFDALSGSRQILHEIRQLTRELYRSGRDAHRAAGDRLRWSPHARAARTGRRGGRHLRVISNTYAAAFSNTTYSRDQYLRGQLDGTAANQAVADLRDWPGERFGHRWLLERMWQPRDSVRGWDAFYVALAEGFDATLLTMDERLALAHEAELQDRATWRRRLIVVG
jgi:predicted nucleic acid-binding protein